VINSSPQAPAPPDSAKDEVVHATSSEPDRSQARSAAPTRETAILWCILAVTAIVYLRCLGNGFVLDDTAMFVHNPDLRHWSFLWKAFSRDEYWYSDAGFLQAYHFRNYRPLFLVLCWIDYHLFGLNPAPWHATILALYLLVVWLVFKIARRVADDSTSALLAASLFALTPVHVAAVTWMCGSAFVLGTALGLAAFYLILPRADGSARNPAAAIALYAGALLCHESLTAFPALVAGYAFLFDPSEFELSAASLWMRARRAVIWMAPFAIELFLYLLTRRLLFGFFVNNPYFYINLLTDAQAVLTVPAVLVTYLTMLIVPWRTLPIHRAFPVSSPLSPDFWAPLAAVMLAVGAFLVVELRDPRRRLHLFCAAWIAFTFVPMVMLHSLPHLVQDYYLYLPSVGWCILLGDAIAVIARQNAMARRLALGAAAAMLIVYAVALWRVEPIWHDDTSVARGYVEGFPESTAWHWNLATKLDAQGDFAGAANEIRTALSLEPDRTGNIFHPEPSALHHFLGELLARRGDIDGAVSQFHQSLIDGAAEDETHSPRPPRPYDPRPALLYWESRDNAKAGHTDMAILKMTHALAMMQKTPVPEYGPMAFLYIPLAELYDKQGNQEQVDAVLKEMDSMPQGELAVGLARARIRLNHSDKEGAERILLELSELYPTNSRVLIPLGDLQFDLKQYPDALISYQRAGAGWFADAKLHLSMAQSLDAMGRRNDALDQCRLAQAMAPRDRVLEFNCLKIQNGIRSR
jgi:tetratricopeptide (TPR) repeat protein